MADVVADLVGNMVADLVSNVVGNVVKAVDHSVDQVDLQEFSDDRYAAPKVESAAKVADVSTNVTIALGLSNGLSEQDPDVDAWFAYLVASRSD